MSGYVADFEDRPEGLLDNAEGIQASGPDVLALLNTTQAGDKLIVETTVDLTRTRNRALSGA